MDYPAFIFWILFLKAAASNQRTLLILLFSSFTFGSLAVLPPEMTGGSSFTPKTMFALLIVVLFVVRPLLTSPRRLLELARPQNLGFLLAFLLISLVTTIFVPRLFENAVDVIPMRTGDLAFGSYPLTPTQANLTQCIYLTISVSVTFAAALMGRSPQFPDDLMAAVRIGGVVMLASGFLDMFATAVGQSAMLDPFRNASYSMLTNVEIAGVRRVVGLMPEASSYGSSCVAFAAALVFLRTSYPAGSSRLFTSLTAIVLIAMALLSTSSSAYAGLTFFGAAYMLNLGRRMASASAAARSGLSAEVTVGFVSTIAFMFVLLAAPETFDPLWRIIDEIIFNKAQSDSFLDRMYWNQVSWNTFASTYGIGVGLGATRASNYFVAVISNTGFLGSSCLFIFLLQTFFRRCNASPAANQIVTALKFTIVPSLGMASLGATTPDFEPWLGIIFGAIMGLSLQRAGVDVDRYATGPAAFRTHQSV